MITVKTGHGDTAHDVLVGDLAASLERIAALADGQLLPLVSDARVYSLHGAALARSRSRHRFFFRRGKRRKTGPISR